MSFRARLTEFKAQRWRALAVTPERQQLLYLGHNYTQVQENYDKPFFDGDILNEEERKACTHVYLQKWMGAPERGSWVTQRSLEIPTTEVTLNIAKKPTPV